MFIKQNSCFHQILKLMTIYWAIIFKLKVKVELSLCLSKYHTMKTYGGVKVQLYSFFDARWRCLVSFTPCRLTPRKRAPGTHWIVGWVEPRPGLDAVVKREIPSSCRDSNSRSSSPQPSGIPLRHPGSLVPVKCFTI